MAMFFRETNDSIVLSIAHRKNRNRDDCSEVLDLADLCARALSVGKSVCCDLSGIERMESELLDELILANQVTKQHSLSLTIVDIHPVLKEVFKTTKLDQIFTIAEEDS
jgi:anti-anti-sigma regulatory factor